MLPFDNVFAQKTYGSPTNELMRDETTEVDLSDVGELGALGVIDAFEMAVVFCRRDDVIYAYVFVDELLVIDAAALN